MPLPLQKSRRDTSKKTRTPAGMQSPPELASQEEAREFPLQLGGWAGCRQPGTATDWGWENLSMERKGPGARAARNLAAPPPS